MKRIAILLLVNVLFIGSCKGPAGDIGPQGSAGLQGPQGAQGLAGPNHRGELTGFVQLRNEDFSLKTDHSGVTVSAESNGAKLTATSAQNGKFTLPTVPMGTYTLTYERSGHATMKVFGVQHIGGSSAPSVVPIQDIRALSTTQITNLKLAKIEISQFDDKPRLLFSTTRADNGGGTCGCRNAFVYLSKDPNPSSSQYSASSAMPVGDEQGKEFTDSFSRSVDYKRGSAPFKSGDAVYAIAYGTIISVSYYDPSTDTRVYTNLNDKPSNIIKITWP